MYLQVQFQEKQHFVIVIVNAAIAGGAVVDVGFEGENKSLKIVVVVVKLNRFEVVNAENGRGIEKNFAFRGENKLE